MRATRDLSDGLRYAAGGQRWMARHGRLWAWGMIPALVALAGYTVALVALAVWGGDLVAWATPFADHWDHAWRQAFRVLLTVTLFGVGLLLAVVSFTAVTLLVGQPFYEELSGRVERAEGGDPPESGLSLWRELLVALREGVVLLLWLALFGVPLFVLGFVPVIGQTVVPAIGFGVSGFFLTLELTTVALQRRRIPLRDRMRMLRSRVWLALGFGVPLVLLFLVPFVAVLAMPGAVAGATLLARDLLVDEEPDGEPDEEPDGTPGEVPGPDLPGRAAY